MPLTPYRSADGTAQPVPSIMYNTIVAGRAVVQLVEKTLRILSPLEASRVLPHRSLLVFLSPLTGPLRPPSAGLAGRSGAGDGAGVDLG
jgi:hypothetical protein